MTTVESVDRKGATLLAAEGLSKRFGGVQAVDDVSLEVREAEIVGLIGPNGSGKSTTFSLISGTVRADRGRVVIGGRDVTGMPPHRIVRRGLVRTFQLTRVFPEMTVFENLAVSVGAAGVEQPKVWELVELVGLAPKVLHRAGELSFGQQKLLELLRAALLEPRLLLLDEPFAGVNETMERQLVALVQHLRRARGSAFLLIDHEMRLMMELCGHIYVMDSGSILCEGPPDVVRHDPATLEAYFGKGHIAGSRGP